MSEHDKNNTENSEGISLIDQDPMPSERKKKKFFSKKNAVVLGGIGTLLIGSIIYGSNVDMPSPSDTSRGGSTDLLPPPSSNQLPKALPTDARIASKESVIGKTMQQQRDNQLDEAVKTGDVFLDDLISAEKVGPLNFENIEDQQKPEMKEPVKMQRSEYNPEIKPANNTAAQTPSDNLIEADSSERLNRIIQTLGAGKDNPYDAALAELSGKGKEKAPKQPTIVQFANPEEYSDYGKDSGYKVVRNGRVTTTNSDGGEETALFKVALGARYYGMPEIMLVSDDKGPAIVKIYEGPLKGAVLGGTYTLNELAEGINITLDRMSYNGRRYAVDARLLNLETGRPVVADDVDHHYFERYGAVGLAALAAGFADTLKTTTQVVGSDGGVTVVEDPINKGKDQFIYALGQVGSVWAKELTKNMNRPITVTTYAGKGAQVLFMDEVEIF